MPLVIRRLQASSGIPAWIRALGRYRTQLEERGAIEVERCLRRRGGREHPSATHGEARRDQNSLPWLASAATRASALPDLGSDTMTFLALDPAGAAIAKIFKELRRRRAGRRAAARARRVVLTTAYCVDTASRRDRTGLGRPVLGRANQALGGRVPVTSGCFHRGRCARGGPGRDGEPDKSCSIRTARRPENEDPGRERPTQLVGHRAPGRAATGVRQHAGGGVDEYEWMRHRRAVLAVAGSRPARLD